MATTTTNFGWDIPQSTDLVKDGATAIAALGQDIDTALVDLKGGTTGQFLSKASGTDLDYTWSTPTSGSLTLLSTTAITTTNSITISSISGAYTHLLIFVENFATTGTHNLTMRLNSDSGSNYNPAQVQGQQGVINNSGTQTSFGVVQYNNVNGTNNGAVIISIPFYSATNAYKALSYQLSATYGGTSNPVCINGAVAYRSTSAITAFTLNTDATNFLAQGNIKIYGVK